MEIRRTLNLKVGEADYEIPQFIKLTPKERRQAYEEQQHIFDLDDIENELSVFMENYVEDYGIDENPVTPAEKEQMARELRRILENDPDCSESQCRSDAVTSVLKNRSAEEVKPQTHMVVEFCQHCENEIEMMWNTDERGFRAICPICGVWLMLCDECSRRGEICDYNRETDRCHMFNKEVASDETV